MSWQPIETAPRDGTPILLWHKIHKTAISAKWNDKEFALQGYKLQWMECTYRTSWPNEAFTHWRPAIEGPDDSGSAVLYLVYATTKNEGLVLRKLFDDLDDALTFEKEGVKKQLREHYGEAMVNCDDLQIGFGTFPLPLHEKD